MGIIEVLKKINGDYLFIKEYAFLIKSIKAKHNNKNFKSFIFSLISILIFIIRFPLCKIVYKGDE